MFGLPGTGCRVPEKTEGAYRVLGTGTQARALRIPESGTRYRVPGSTGHRLSRSMAPVLEQEPGP